MKQKQPNLKFKILFRFIMIAIPMVIFIPLAVIIGNVRWASIMAILIWLVALKVFGEAIAEWCYNLTKDDFVESEPDLPPFNLAVLPPPPPKASSKLTRQTLEAMPKPLQLAGADLHRLFLDNVDWLRGADLSGADLRWTYLEGCDLSLANLQKADLQGSHLNHVKFVGSDLRWTKLKGAIINETTQIASKWHLVWELMTQGGQKRYLIGADLSETCLEEADLSGANLHGANLSASNLWGINLEFANLQQAQLGQSNLVKASLVGADLHRANMYACKLSGADLTRANLSGANLTEANLSGANLCGANLREANLTGINLRNITIYDKNTQWPKPNDFNPNPPSPSLTFQARLIKSPRRADSELPHDLSFFKDNHQFLQPSLWKKEMPEYQEFMTVYKLKSSKGSYRCPECQTLTVQISHKNNVFAGYTVRDEYTDANHYHSYDIYICKTCKLGWTELTDERTYLDTSGW